MGTRELSIRRLGVCAWPSAIESSGVRRTRVLRWMKQRTAIAWTDASTRTSARSAAFVAKRQSMPCDARAKRSAPTKFLQLSPVGSRSAKTRSTRGPSAERVPMSSLTAAAMLSGASRASAVATRRACATEPGAGRAVRRAAVRRMTPSGDERMDDGRHDGAVRNVDAWTVRRL